MPLIKNLLKYAESGLRDDLPYQKGLFFGNLPNRPFSYSISTWSSINGRARNKASKSVRAGRCIWHRQGGKGPRRSSVQAPRGSSSSRMRNARDGHGELGRRNPGHQPSQLPGPGWGQPLTGEENWDGAVQATGAGYRTLASQI